MANYSDYRVGSGIRPVFVNSNYTAKANEAVWADSSGGPITITLLASPLVGTAVRVSDAGGNAGTNNITIGRNGNTIVGVAEDFIINLAFGVVDLVWTGSTWEVTVLSAGGGLAEADIDARFVALSGFALVNVQSGTSYTIQVSDAGKVVVFTNGAAIAVTLPDTLDDFFQFTVVQAGAGVPTVTRSGTDTINGASDGVTPSDQWKGAYFTQYASGSWLALL